MTAEEIAKKYVHGLHDALTDRQEIKDMMTDIENYAERYHQAKLKLLGVTDVIGRSEQFYCVSSDALVYGKPCNEWCGSEHCKAICKQ